ncbi:hypothetical protein [Burkholderia cenocepacia]|uniref:hypothetical protein n=1 Tax=Burkholderia cenocepacia TaxID=95486 RepID=UPI002B24A4BC|nr:hypothetical protein [Burkholderia cenocepacia]MEB2558771.1 hypothetical protein [Burkholderia cenocepacia]
MNRIFRWIRWGIRALLIFILSTAVFGVASWLIGRDSVGDLIAAAIVAFGWIAIGFVMWKSGWSREVEEW